MNYDLSMTVKPQTADGYESEALSHVRATCLYMATVLGDLADDRLVIVGGLVPQLIMPSDADEPHVGTHDLDLGLSLALLETEQYHEVAARLRGAGFAPDQNGDGRLTRQRWLAPERAGARVRVDFLIPPPPSAANPMHQGGRILGLEADFAAYVIPGLELAWRDRIPVTISGQTLLGERATRTVWVCGPGAFLVLKALAFSDRGEPKDAYDLYYVARNYGAGPHEIANALLSLRDHPLANKAIEILRRDFMDVENVGPHRVGAFLRRSDEDLRADVVAFIGEVVRLTA